MKTDHPGTSDEARLKAGQILNRILVDENMLATTTRDYYWNATGPQSRNLRQQLGEQVKDIERWLDEVAERAGTIGIGVQGNWLTLVKSTRSSAHPGIGLGADKMLSELLALHEELILQLRTDSDVCAQRLNDADTADVLTGLMKQHEMTAEKLRSELGGKPNRNPLISFNPSFV